MPPLLLGVRTPVWCERFLLCGARLRAGGRGPCQGLWSSSPKVVTPNPSSLGSQEGNTPLKMNLSPLFSFGPKQTGAESEGKWSALAGFRVDTEPFNMGINGRADTSCKLNTAEWA